MTDDDLRGLVDRAAFLHERLEPSWQPIPNPFERATVEARLARWRRLTAGDHDERFARRLAWLGLDESSADRILGAGGYAPGRPLPDWAGFLAQAVDSSAETRAAGIVPALVRAAEARLAQTAGETLAWLAPTARRALSAYLRGRLERLAQAILAENDNRSLTSYCLHYPVLARQLAQHCLDWTAEVADFLQRLAGDWPALAQYLRLPPLPDVGVVAELTPDLSDPHRGGRTVWRVLLSGAQPVAYKPKNLLMDRAWNELLGWCNEQGLRPQLSRLWVLARREYGWMEWADGDGDVAGDVTGDVTGDPRQWGMLLGLLHLLHAADCHRENLVIRKGQPLLVDGEMLVYPRFAGREKGDPLDVLRTGLLPRWLAGVDGPVSFGALTEGFPPGAVEEGYADCLAFLSGRWEALSDPSGPLAPFRGGEVRVAPRPTAAYSRLLAHLRQPACLGEGVDFSIEVDRLAHTFLASPERERLHPLLAAEHQAISRGDVPLFHGAPGQPELLYAGGALPDALTWPAFALPSGTAQREQAGLIRAALERSAWLSSASVSFLETARQVGDLLAERAVPVDRGGVGWIGVEYRPGSGLFQHGLGGDDLYAGRAGIALFLAGLHRATGEARWRELALAGLTGGDDPATDPGGRIYALTTAAQLLAAPELAERAAGLAERLSSEGDGWRRSAGYPWGVLDGETGLLLGLLALHHRTVSDDLLAMAVASGDRILRAGSVWVLPQSENPSLSPTAPAGSVTGGEQETQRNFHLLALGGFSHGAAGIAWGLARLYAATGEARFLEGAARGWAFQHRLYDEAAGNWQDLRGEFPVYLDNWCNGAAGVGLAAAGSLAALPELAEVVERAGARLLAAQSPFLDTLCCGGFGQIDCLLEMGLRCRRPEWVSAAIAQAESRLGEARQRGGFRLYDDLPAHLFNPGFFRGAAGIGYTLLRLAAESGETEWRLPCVLGIGEWENGRLGDVS